MIEWLSQINPNELVKASFGGIVGFVLAQLFNIAKAVRDGWLQPRYEISQEERGMVYGSGGDSFVDPITGSKLYTPRYEAYGFKVKNVGRSVASSIRARLIRVERCVAAGPINVIYDKSSELWVYGGEEKQDVVLPPGASVIFQVGFWAAGNKAVGFGGVLEERIKENHQYFCTVVVFDPQGRFKEETIAIEVPYSQHHKGSH